MLTALTLGAGHGATVALLAQNDAVSDSIMIDGALPYSNGQATTAYVRLSMYCT